MSDLRVRQVRGDDLTVSELYAVLRLRAEVFVVEQDCSYLDPDGHDLEPSTTHVWFERDGGEVTSYLRVLPAPEGGTRIGRVVTPREHRGHGLAGQLLTAALDGAERPVLLHAQSHLVGMYERLGFAVDGDAFLDDGIPHTPMRLA